MQMNRSLAAAGLAAFCPVFGPFEPLMYSPQVMTPARAMGDYLRYRSAIGNKLSELAILVTAREWTQDYEWYVHHPIALKVGIKPETADAIAQGSRPSGLSEDEEAVYDFTLELLRNKRVSDATFAHAEGRFCGADLRRDQRCATRARRTLGGRHVRRRRLRRWTAPPRR
jgi:hypothetical protein